MLMLMIALDKQYQIMLNIILFLIVYYIVFLFLHTNFRTEPYDKFLNTLKGRSVYGFGIDVTTDDKILTLSTCDNTGTKRVAVHAKMINIEYK